ncbi:hypothetical protein [Aeromonas phage AerS_266]|nr:hypothetical protein [Aeromonas phage AerS_266]
MLKKFLMLFSFFRKREILKLRKQLDLIKDDFTGGYFNNKYIVALHNILKSSVISFKDDLVYGSLKHIQVHSKSSSEALKRFKKLNDTIETVSPNPSVNSKQITKYFSLWYSSESSVIEFFEYIQYFLNIQVNMEDENIVTGFDGNPLIRVVIDEKEEQFLESLLYRLLLVDATFILDFYLESAYEE